MYMLLTKDAIIPEDEVIGIFDLDNVSWSKRTRDYLATSERAGRLTNLAEGLPRSLIVTQERDYLVSLSPQRLALRRLRRNGLR